MRSSCPAGREEVAQVLGACAQEGVAVIPFGGGTSVVGGVEPLRRPFEAAISVDLTRLHGLLELDERSQLATFAAGTLGPDVERLLGARGLTLGHFPQSFEFSTVGGWAATRSAGQASTGYGRIDELVVALRAATPGGEIATPRVPASAAGPSLRELLLGSEGVLGIITDVTLRVRPRPSRRRYEAWSLPDFAAGCEALRELGQARATPDVARLSDEDETRLSLVLASRPAATRLMRAYLAARGHGRGCLAILGFDGELSQIAPRRAAARTTLRRHGALALGPAPGAAWAKGRFHGAYVRDELLRRGVLVDTLETATTWTRLGGVHRAVGEALRRALASLGTPLLVLCHVSHLYPTGASLYFTFLAARQQGAELEQWHTAKAAATDAICAAGATLTHHHAVGRDHAPWLPQEVGELGIDALRALKARLDPAGIMNPGKLVDARADQPE
jgi:alkyldihydroxyacetonephosphate synthase